MAEDQQAANPLQLGQTLYEVLDATVIATPKASADARYHRVICDASGSVPAEPLGLGVQDEILDVKAATDTHAAVQNVYVLTSDSVHIIGSSGGNATARTWAVSGLRTIVGIDPQRTADPWLLLLGQDANGMFLQWLDCASGGLAPSLRLPSTAVGTAADALLVRQQLQARVLVCAVHDGQLVVHDLGSCVLGDSPAVPAVTSLTLGQVRPDAPVGLAAASLVPGTADQQVVVTYPDQDGSLRIAVLGWDKGTLASIASAKPDLSFAPPEAPLFRVTAAELLTTGADQIVVGYPATYGQIAGCAALLLFELDTPGHEPSQLRLLSRYAAANEVAGDHQPFASIDLHVAAGLFGEALPSDQRSPQAGSAGVLGVLVIGGGATFAQLLKGEASILAGMVVVDPAEKAFPPLGSAPGVPQGLSQLMTIDYRSPGFFALPSDVTGQSVILGPPTLSQSLAKGQLLAIIQAPPFETAVSAGKPTLTFGQSVSQIKGYNVSSNKNWMFTHDTAGTIGIASQTLSRNVSSTYGHGFDQLDDKSTSTLVQSTATISEDDLMVLYAMSYYVWTYPVYRKAKQDKPDGTMAVIFPMTPEPVQTLTPASDPSIGYLPRSQTGVLLSYAHLKPDGYDPSQLLFNLISMPVTDDTGGTTLTFDQTQMVSENISKSFTVHNSATDSAHFSYSTTLLSYIPVNFGLNITDGQSYSESDMQTTMLSHTTTMSIVITSGSVTDIGYEYQITPYIYQHKDMGCLMVTYDVTMPGRSWDSYYKIPQILLQPLYPNSKDPVLRGFSRSISFTGNQDGSVDVHVELFNNGLKEVQDIICDFYRGAPVVVGKDTKKLAPPGPAAMTGTKTLPRLSASGRETITATMKLAQGEQVAVNVYVSGLQPFGEVYWGIYPASAFASSGLARAALADEQGRLAQARRPASRAG
jgi:hypothetical protein